MGSEDEVKTGLFITRAQPFHKGHLDVIKQMEGDPGISKILIGIGSSQYHNFFDNPFSVDERIMMISLGLWGASISKPYSIIQIPDINDYPNWVAHVEKLTPPFQVVYGNNELVKQLFEQKGYLFKRPKDPLDISATKIRHLIITGGYWKNLVPSKTYAYIREIGGDERIVKLYREFVKTQAASDIIIDHGEGIVLIKRSHEPFKNFWALPGGKLEVGFESLEQTAIRETFEETSIVIDLDNLHLLNIYSKPQRDPRGPMISAVYFAKTFDGKLKAGDDAKEVRVFKYDEIPDILAFDHREIIRDFLKLKS